MTPRQEAFCREYLIDLCATQAAIRAGYSDVCAKTISSRLLTNVNVQKKIEALKLERARSLDITAERVLKELARMAFVDPSEIFTVDERGRVIIKPTSELSEDQRRAIQSVSETESGVKIKLADKMRALELVGKHIGLFADRVELTGPNGGPVKTSVSGMSDEELRRIADANAT